MVLLKGILFDLDGTLVDNVPQFLQAFHHAYETIVDKPFDENAVLMASGRRSRDVVEALGIPENLQDRFIQEFRSYRETLGGDATKLFPGVLRTLSVLKDRGVKMAIVSSKRREIVLRDLADFGIDGFFETVLGSEDVVEHKPHPGALLLACNRLQLLPSREVAAVGDSIYDVQAAKSAGLFSVGVVWGAHRREISRANPDRVIESFDQLLDLIEG